MRIRHINPFNLAVFFTYVGLVLSCVAVIGDIFHYVSDILGSAAKLFKGPYHLDLFFISIATKFFFITATGWLTGFLSASLFNRFNKSGIEVQIDSINIENS